MTASIQPSPAMTFETCVRSTQVSFTPRTLAYPFQLSTGAIDEITEACVDVEVEVGAARTIGKGSGSIYLSDLWAWPDPAIDHRTRDLALRAVCEQIADQLPKRYGTELLHPLETGLRLHHWTCHDLKTDAKLPHLALAMCASPFDAAIHDAVGQAFGISAFRFYDSPVKIPAADSFFPDGSTVRAICRMLQTPRFTLPAWLLISKDESLDDTMAKSVRHRGYYCYKIKIGGRDNAIDVQRTIDVYRKAKSLGITRPRLTLDSNESNPSADSVLDFLHRLESADADAMQALEYIEQPTGRDINEHAYDWKRVTAKKPVFLDEGLADLTTLGTAQSQGWSGLALKTCKGHSMMLATAAWGHEHGMALSLQDLTNPGISMIHAALVGAYLPTVNGAELNSPQFTPAANVDFLPRLAPLFEPQHGEHKLTNLSPPGLGSSL